MSFTVQDRYSIDLSINNIQVDFSKTVLEEVLIIESIWQSLPVVEITIINDGELVEVNPLLDGSQIDLILNIFNTGGNEELRMETVLWTHTIEPYSEGFRINMKCILSAPDFLEGRIESVNGSSFDVFSTMADRSRMTLIADPSIDQQVWLRAGIRGNVWLNDVINRSWASPESAFIYAVTRDRELLRYNLSERAARNPVWTFQPQRELNEVEIPDETILYKYPRFNSQSGLLNSFFGYGRSLSNFNLETGELDVNSPKSFVKRTNFMNLNEDREVSQRHDSLGYNNALNVHENYFNAYTQNMRLKSFYSSSVELLSEYVRPVRLLDRVTLQLYNESNRQTQDVYAGDYFVKNITTMLDPNKVTRRFTLTREGINANAGTAGNSK